MDLSSGDQSGLLILAELLHRFFGLASRDRELFPDVPATALRRYLSRRRVAKGRTHRRPTHPMIWRGTVWIISLARICPSLSQTLFGSSPDNRGHPLEGRAHRSRVSIRRCLSGLDSSHGVVKSQRRHPGERPNDELIESL